MHIKFVERTTSTREAVSEGRSHVERALAGSVQREQHMHRGGVRARYGSEERALVGSASTASRKPVM